MSAPWSFCTQEMGVWSSIVLCPINCMPLKFPEYFDRFPLLVDPRDPNDRGKPTPKSKSPVMPFYVSVFNHLSSLPPLWSSLFTVQCILVSIFVSLKEACDFLPLCVLRLFFQARPLREEFEPMLIIIFFKYWWVLSLWAGVFKESFKNSKNKRSWNIWVEATQFPHWKTS